MEIYGNSTSFNVESVLRANIGASDYYKHTCMQLTSVSQVVDEIYENVYHVEPWMSGNARGPSTAFCLMFRLFTLRVSEEDMHGILNHQDSPYIRAVGFLYLRYVGDPKTLWTWCEPFAKDREEFSPSPDGKLVTIGDFVRDILLDQYYFETIFPRIPKKAQDEIIEELRRMGLPTMAKGNAGAGGGDRRGVEDGSKRPASVKASLSVAMGQRAPNRAAAREEGRGKDPSLALRTADAASARDDHRSSPAPGRPAAERLRNRSRERSRDRSAPSGDYERNRDRNGHTRGGYERRNYDGSHRGGSSSYRNGDTERDAGRNASRDGSRGVRDDGRNLQGAGSYDAGLASSRNGGRIQSREGAREASGRDAGRGSSRDGGDRGYREAGSSRDREGGRDTRDVFQDGAWEARQPPGADELKARYGDAGSGARGSDRGRGPREREVYRLGGGANTYR